MPHVDDGRLEAWLDRDRSGMRPEEVESIRAHLDTCAACSARLAEASRLRTRSAAILGGTSLGDDRMPDFESIRARAGARGIPVRSDRGAGRRLVTLAWAASLAAAVGLGWLTRDLFAPRQVALESVATREQERALAPPEASAPDGPPAEASAARDDADASAGSPEVARTAGAADELEAAEAGGAVGAVLAVQEGDGRGRAEAPAAEGRRASLAAEGPPAADSARPEDVAMSAASPSPPSSASGPAEEVLAEGLVVSANGDPIEGALVFVDAGRATLTDTEGRYSLRVSEERLASGEVGVTAQMLGYVPQTRALTQPAGDTIAVDFEMTPSTVALNAVVAVGYASRDSLATLQPAAAPEVDRGQAPGVPVIAEQRIAEAAGPPPMSLSGQAQPPLEVAGETVTIDEAARRLGSRPVTVPGIEIVSMEMVGDEDAPVLHLRQRLSQGGILLLVQNVGESPAAVPSVPTGSALARIRRGVLHVAAIAPMSAELLRELLESSR